MIRRFLRWLRGEPRPLAGRLVALSVLTASDKPKRPEMQIVKKWGA